MAVPRVFISSTYYDLRHVREDVGNFIKSMGYEPVMHDRGGIPYTQSEPLENSCYNELQNCDIVVCIIGNKYGTKSQDSDLSITMTELMSAIKARKKIYIYILKEVYFENRTYLLNKDKDFTPASVDDIKIHQFIAEIKDNVKNHPIEPFENISDIIENLKIQFAGLFQSLLTKEASLTESKTAYDLQSSADKINESLKQFENEIQEFFDRFDGSIVRTNYAVRYIQKLIGLSAYQVFIPNRNSLIKYMNSVGFDYDDDPREEYVTFYKINNDMTSTLYVDERLFNENGKIKNIKKTEEIMELIQYKEDTIDDINNDLAEEYL